MKFEHYFEKYMQFWNEYRENCSKWTAKQKRYLMSRYSHKQCVTKLAWELEKLSGLKVRMTGPCGLRSEYLISLSKNGEWKGEYSITISLASVTEFFYDTGGMINRYDPGTIGYLNGFNHATAPLPMNTEKVFEIMKGLNNDKG